MTELFAKVRAQISSLDAFAAIDGLTLCCDYVWREANLDNMIKRSMRVLREVFGIPAVYHYQLTGRGTHVRLESSSTQLKKQPPLDAKIEKQIEAQLKLINLGQQDYKQGTNFLSIGKESYSFCVLGENTSVWRLLIWPEEEKTESLVARSDHLKIESIHKKCLDFFIRQLQVMSRAYARFQKSQILLMKDDLTGLYNYRYLEACLDNEIRRVQRFRGNFSLLFIDLDNFKPINDSYGHLSGSRVLKQVAGVLKEGLREVDSVFRYGGDEYVVLLIEANSRTATLAAERMRENIAKTEFLVEDGKKVKLTASIGVASCPEHGVHKQDLLKMADTSMYCSKNSGKNQVIVVGKTQPIKAAEDLRSERK